MRKKQLNITLDNPDKTKEVETKVAQAFLDPKSMAALSIKERYISLEGVTVDALIEELDQQSKAVRGNDMARVEDMLLSQAHALDNLCYEMLERGRKNMGDYLNAAHKYIGLGLKAQSQCRMTLEALAEIKNPKPYIQNNKAQYQQVNNTPSMNEARTEKLKQSNELLEQTSHDEQWMDTGAPKTASKNDQELEAVET